MFHKLTRLLPLLLLAGILTPKVAQANPGNVRYSSTHCEFYLHGETQPQHSMDCRFAHFYDSHNRNDMEIIWADGVRSEFESINIGSRRNSRAIHQEFIDRNGAYAEAFMTGQCDLGIRMQSGTIYVTDMGYCG